MRFYDIRFTVVGGRSILIEADPSTPDRDIRLWLLGSVMAALLHQRGYLTIHANVLALGNGSAAAFAGDSGAGKSTLAAWFDQRGHRVLADDLCAIAPGLDGEPRLFEGIPRVKLWADALAGLGRNHEGLEKVASDLDKYHLPLSTSSRPGSLDSLKLERIYLLSETAENQPFTIHKLAGVEAANGVLANAYRWQLGQMIQPPRAQFDHCLALARCASVFRVNRRWGFDNFADDTQAIERHMLTPLSKLGIA